MLDRDGLVRCDTCDRSIARRAERPGLQCSAWTVANGQGQRFPIDIPRDQVTRCFFYKPKPGDPDQRKGREIWPCTEAEYKEAHQRRLRVWWAWMNPTVDNGKKRA